MKDEDGSEALGDGVGVDAALSQCILDVCVEVVSEFLGRAGRGLVMVQTDGTGCRAKIELIMEL